ncbi:hypothetical protein CMV_011046 [Castanea mollissima]|uniref:Phorbol-ester/DAG-type domain-containing protein n=1 Tax=Castanea mollissima TaxID=60419 RepID=A0A8J4RHD8_9ROSI|nr:hypothetical protein CMV_011046 [Castanea mollissima]
MEQPQQQLLHFSHSNHPLDFEQDLRGGATCCGCQESVYGPAYYCGEWWGKNYRVHHKSCAELPIGLHHPLHPIHPLILFDEKTHYPEEEEDKQKTKCQLCNESRRQYTYRCYRCDFNLHATCASLPPTIESSQVHHHPLTPFWKWMSFTCDLCAKEVKGIPNQCALCSLWFHNSCASLPRRLKVIRHKHLLHLTHSYLEVKLHQSDSRFCQICVKKVNTNFGFYYCSKCDFVAHLDCAADYRNRENINLLKLKEEENEDSELNQSATYKVKNIKVGVDGTEIATEIQHFSHEHDLKLSDDEVLNNEKCNGCVQAIFPPFYSCVNCRFFLHESCAKLPRKKRHPLHQHLLTLFSKSPYYWTNTFQCYACERYCNGFSYRCGRCNFNLDVPCSLISDILTHPGHEHRLLLSSIESKHNCSCCDSKISPIFRCTTCDFALDFKCATLPQTARYKQHEHPFTLRYIAEDDSGEYYCDICEEERDPKHWFYYCANCDYPAHTKCILGKNPNLK